MPFREPPPRLVGIPSARSVSVWLLVAALLALSKTLAWMSLIVLALATARDERGPDVRGKGSPVAKALAWGMTLIGFGVIYSNPRST